MTLATSLDAPLASERTQVFLLSLGDAGEDLPPTEIERVEAEALAPGKRAAFRARRRLLRRAVALRLGLAPSDILVARDAQGAPRVASAREPIFVSLASRGELVAMAVSDRPVGVDVELIEPAPAPGWNILHAREREWLSQQGSQARPERFLALWCAKEAYLKALGLGLRREPTEVAISINGEGRLAIEDCGRPVPLDEGFVTRSDAYGIPAMLAWTVLAR